MERQPHVYPGVPTTAWLHYWPGEADASGGTKSRGLHPDSPLLAEAIAIMVRTEAIEREEMHSIVTQLTELKTRLRCLQSRVERWRQWRQPLLDEFEADGMPCSESDDAPTQPEAEPPERGR